MSVRARAILALGVLCLCAAAGARAADVAAPAQPAVAPAAAPAVHPSPLEIGGRTIVTFRAAAFGYRPDERAEGARVRRLRAYEKNHAVALATRHVSEGSQVLADGAIMFVVTPADVYTIAGETPEQAANQAVDILRTVVSER